MSPKFEAPERSGAGTRAEETIAPPHHNEIDMCQLMAYAWDDFLAANGDVNVATSLGQIDSALIFPRPRNSVPDKYGSNDPLVRHTDVVAHITGGRIPTYDIPGMENALHKLEARRKLDYEDWLDELKLDCVVWPCNGDVGKADADVNEASAVDAWRNGVLYSNGNCAIRQLGIPTISVPMGVMKDTRMPVNLTFAGKAYKDNDLLRYAYAFEKSSPLRQSPSRTPSLVTDAIPCTGVKRAMGSQAPRLVTKVMPIEDQKMKFRIVGQCEDSLKSLHIYVDGEEVSRAVMEGNEWRAEIERVGTWSGRAEAKGSPDPEKAMVIVLAIGTNGRSTGKLLFV